MSGGGSSTPQQQTVTQNTSNLPAYAQPYFQDILGQAQSQFNTQTNPYVPYPGQRVANLNADQNFVGQQIMNEGTTGYANAKGLASSAGAADLAYHYDPTQFTNQTVTAPTLDPSDPRSQMTAAQSGYNPNLTTFQIGAPQNFGQDQAQQYMSPYMQNVVDVTKAQNLRDAQKDQLANNLNAARQGTYGGARQLLATTERERNLGDLQSKTQATGLQAAYENAQQQFERDRSAGLGVASQNLQAQLGVQQLGTQTGAQMALANLSNQQQANVQNQAAFLQTQGLSAQQALQAALANQQADLAKQQAAEQSKQFGATSGLQALQQATQAASTEGTLAGQQQASDLARFQEQMAYGTQQQQNQQQHLDQQYQDFLQQRNYPMEQLGYYSNILHGLPVGVDQTTAMYAPPPSAISQIGGLGLGALGLANLAKG